MAILPQLVEGFMTWCHSSAEPKPETELVAQAETKVKELLESASQPLDEGVIKLAISIALAENAEKIQAVAKDATEQLLQETVSSDEFQRLKVGDLAQAKVAIEAVGNRCLATAEGIVRQYAPEPDARTPKLLKLKSLSKHSQEFLYDLLIGDEMKEVKGLLKNSGEFYSTLQHNICHKLQNLRDNRVTGSSKLTTIFEEIYKENQPEALHNPPDSYRKKIKGNIKDAIVSAIESDLQAYTTTWLDQLTAGLAKIFGFTSEKTKQFVFAASVYCTPALPVDISAELQLALGLEGGVMSPGDFESGLDEFQEKISLQEKYFTLLSLVLFFTEIYKVLGTTNAPNCHPFRRHLNRALVLKLLTREKDVYPENEWVLVHLFEDLIGHYLSQSDSPPGVKLQVEKWNEDEENEDSVSVFDFTPLTPALYPNTHITIAISGWMSEGTDMMENWKTIATHMHYGAMYALNWESGTETGEAAKGAAGVAVVVGLAAIPVVGLFMAPAALYALWKAEPFQTATLRAEATGKCLAHHIRNRAFGNVSISIVCFSLGAHVTATCLSELAQDSTQYVQDVVLFGGATPVEGWEERRRAIAGRLINVHSDEDDVLTFAYQTARFNKPAGLNSIQADGVTNVDASKFVFGHMDHKAKFDKTMTSINYIP